MNIRFTLYLFLIILFFLIKGLFLIFLIPPWEAPDEPGHVAYVVYLFKCKRIPSSIKPFILSSISKSLIESRKTLNSIRANKLKIPARNLELFDRNETKLDPPILANLASHPPLYYVYLLPFYVISLLLSSYGSLILLRTGSLVLGALSLIIVFLIAKKLFPLSRTTPYVITFLVSFQPMFSFISAVVNIDIMVVFSFLLFIYLAVVLLKTKKDPKYIFTFLMLIIAFSPLIKPQLIVLIPLYFLLLFLNRERVKIYYFYSTILVVIPSVFWFLYKFMVEGTHFLTYSLQNFAKNSTPFWNYPLEFVLGKQPIGIFMSFWGFFGWLDVPMPKWTYVLYLFLMIISILGYLKFKNQVIALFLRRKKIVFFILVVLIMYSLSIFVYDMEVFILSHAFNIHGRYLAPILPLLIIFLIQGLLFYPQNLRNIFIILTVIIFIQIQLVALVIINHHYYGSFFLPKVPLTRIYRF